VYADTFVAEKLINQSILFLTCPQQQITTSRTTDGRNS